MREKVTSFTFIGLLAVFFLLVSVLPKDEMASVKENRPLAEMPEVSFNNIFFGNFTTDYETYLTDNVAYRSRFVDFGTKFEKLWGIERKEAEKVAPLADGKKLVLSNGKIMEVFKANPDVRKQYISVLNDYAKKLDSDMYIMIAPTQLEFDSSEYSHYADSQKETIDAIYSGLKGYKTVNVYDKLKANKDSYIYFRTDHHWTQRGAYLGYEAISKATGHTPTPLKDLTHNSRDGFLGYLYNQANAPEYSKYADTIEYFMPEENYTIAAQGPNEKGEIVDYTGKIYNIPPENTNPDYGLFMSGDHAFAKIETNNKNGKTALIIKDSYANAVLPLLTENYQTILVIDPRNYFGTLDDLKKEHKIDDCIIINYVFTSTFSDYVDNLNRIK
ncbi:MAG: hypothetical protein E7415_03820 [Ruminococcaceae bacterium]|nr:hypothetical protein [Oscillospiraceae bacterium]